MKTVLNYTVLCGDTLSEIAGAISAASGISDQQIAAANAGLNANALNIGEVIDIPANNGSDTVLHYTLLSADTLIGISAALAQCSGLQYPQIVQNNAGLVANQIRVGQRLNIPATTTQQPAPVALPQLGAVNIGYWAWTWTKAVIPTDTGISIAFSGWTDVTTALQQSTKIMHRLVGDKYICLGGGNQDGAFTRDNIQAITAAINNGEFTAFEGIAYDVEGGDAGLADDFAASFTAAKANGYKVLVTVSHSAPYAIKDAQLLMQSFFADNNIDFLSPQLYTTGSESANDYDISHGLGWSEYVNCQAVIIPSLVKAAYYGDAQQYFSSQGVTLAGYVQWR